MKGKPMSNIGEAIHEERLKTCREYSGLCDQRRTVIANSGISTLHGTSYLDYSDDKKTVNKLQDKHIKKCRTCAIAKQSVRDKFAKGDE